MVLTIIDIDIILIIVTYIVYFLLATLGATLGLHRYWSHNQGKRRIWFEWISLSCALCIGVYKPLSWIGTHRMHHKYSDTPKDPHSPKYQGIWNVLLSRWNKPLERKLIKDVIKNKRLIFFQKYGKYLIVPIIIMFPIFILMGYAGIGILNYFGHKDNKPMNRWFINVLAPFEGNHDTHHKSRKFY